jgi:hypothetical protein
MPEEENKAAAPRIPEEVFNLTGPRYLYHSR